MEQLPHNNKSSDTNETISEIAVDEKFPVDEPKVHTSDENPEMETASGQEIESATDPVPEVKSVRGRRGNIVGTKSVEEKCKAPEPSEDAVIPPSVRGRRDKKTEATAPPTVRQTTRGRNAKTTESTDAEMETDQDAPLPSKVALKPKRGRGAKQAFADQAEIVQEVEAAKVPELEAEPSDVNQESNDDTAPVEKVIVKPRRGRRAKQSVQTEQEEVPSTLVDDLPQIDKSEGVGLFVFVFFVYFPIEIKITTRFLSLFNMWTNVQQFYTSYLFVVYAVEVGRPYYRSLVQLQCGQCTLL